MNLAVLWVPVERLRPNPWNPNRQDQFIYERELESIRRFGFIDPVLVRTILDETYLEIIDGEHRWRGAKDLGMGELPVIDLGPLDDDVAKQLTIVLNETRGVAQPDLLAKLLADLSTRHSVADLLTVLPYTKAQFEGFVAPSVDWSAIEDRKPPPERERWVLRSYRLPADAALVIDEAISRVQEDDRCPDWQALERLAADYIAGH